MLSYGAAIRLVCLSFGLFAFVVMAVRRIRTIIIISETVRATPLSCSGKAKSVSPFAVCTGALMLCLLALGQLDSQGLLE